MTHKKRDQESWMGRGGGEGGGGGGVRVGGGGGVQPVLHPAPPMFCMDNW